MNKNIELRKKLAAFITASTILTSVAGCNAKTNTSTTTTTTPSTTTTVETTVEPTETTVAVNNKDFATEEYMTHAKAVATAMYDNNKAYFDEKQYTVEDLENVYYVLNGKYYDNENNLIMEKAELDRSFDIIRELVMPQRVTEMLQKYRDLEHGNISETEYFDEVKASTFYDYRVSLTNLLDVNPDNEDLRNFVSDYSVEMVKVTENVKNGVSPEEHLLDFFSRIRAAQSGNLTYYNGINNYLQENTTEDGYAFMVAAIYKATADNLNTVIDGHYVDVKISDTNDEKETVRIGYSYDEQILVNAFYEGNLVETDAILAAKKLITELFQTMPFDVMCYRQVNINENFGFATNTAVKTF
jgi:hypothetical protein